MKKLKSLERVPRQLKISSLWLISCILSVIINSRFSTSWEWHGHALQQRFAIWSYFKNIILLFSLQTALKLSPKGFVKVNPSPKISPGTTTSKIESAPDSSVRSTLTLPLITRANFLSLLDDENSGRTSPCENTASVALMHFNNRAISFSSMPLKRAISLFFKKFTFLVAFATVIISCRMYNVNRKIEFL